MEQWSAAQSNVHAVPVVTSGLGSSSTGTQAPERHTTPRHRRGDGGARDRCRPVAPAVWGDSVAKFWFGEQRRSLCQGRNADPVDCFGPPHLSAFHSVGSRLFRVRTYHAAYLRNLQIFPRVVTFRAHSGEYRACDHDFRAGNGSVQIVRQTRHVPVAPYFIRSKPEITWHGLQYDEEFIIAIIDVGFGTLNYLLTGAARLRAIGELRPEPNPMVVAVFRRSKGSSLKMGRADDFDISKFMLDNDLAD
ncbi:hypothetical protein OSTOST_09736, partial [Ostertagia ostertagi]